MTEEQKQHTEAVFNDVAAAITEFRQYRRLTVEEAAQKIGMPVKKLEAIERGTFFNNTPALCRIVEAMQGRLAIIPQESPDDPHCQFIELED